MDKTVQKIVIASLIVVALVGGILFLLWISPLMMIKGLMEGAYRQLIAASVPHRLALGALLILGTPFILSLMRLLGIRAPFLDDVWPAKKLQALTLVIVYMGGFSLALQFLMKDQLFAAGETKYYCTVDGYHFFERKGVCPVHGVAFQEVTPQIAEIYRAAKKSRPVKVTPGADGPFWDAATGRPIIWFARDPATHTLVAYDRVAFDPRTGRMLMAADSALIGEYLVGVQATETEEAVTRAQREASEAVAANRAALRQEIASVSGQVGSDPENPDLYYRLGSLQKRAGNRAAALDAFRKALWFEPGMKKAEDQIRSLGAEP